MPLKSEMCCPTSDFAKGVSVERAKEELHKREQRKTSQKFKEQFTKGFDFVANEMDKIRFEEQENVRPSFELSGIKVTDSQWKQIKDAAHYLEDNNDESLQD